MLASDRGPPLAPIPVDTSIAALMDAANLVIAQRWIGRWTLKRAEYITPREREGTVARRD